MKQTLHKALSMLLTVAMVLNVGMVPVFAEDTAISESVMTDCHSAHDSDCGYGEISTIISPCTHSCEICKPADELEQNVCTCPLDDSGELVHRKKCQFYVAPKLKEEAISDFSFKPKLPSGEEMSALLEQIHQRNSANLMADEEPLKTIEVDNSEIIHRPVDYLSPEEIVLDDMLATYGLIDENQSGPFEEGDERYFRIEVADRGLVPESYRAVQSKLVATGDNTNVWVVDDVDFHAKTNTVHDSDTCNLKSVTYAMAKDLATGFDGIYSRMTADFGSFEYHESSDEVLPEFGDLGNDEDVNILLYDIDALDANSSGGYVAGYFWNADLFVANQIFDDSEIIYPIDMFHVDIGTNQGWNSLSGDEKAKLQIYGTLAHEFQHMLYYTHFGIYLNTTMYPSSYYIWYNESLSGLADIYYVQPGAEIIDLQRTAYAASNPYNGVGYGDLFCFNSSMKNYGMGYLFSAMFHNISGGNYARGVYGFFDSFGNDTTSEGFDDKSAAINNRNKFQNPYYHISAMLNSGYFQYPEANLLDAIVSAYIYFMLNFASDGGINWETRFPTQKLLRGTANEQNLWALRPLLGKGILSTLEKLPTLASNDNIIIKDEDSQDPNKFVTRDMMYKLDGSGKAINIALSQFDYTNKSALFYLVLKNQDSTIGADIYPLKAGAISDRIVTNDRDAYLFVATFLSDINESDNLTVTYTWEENLAPEDWNGTASIDNISPRIGDTLKGSYTGTTIIQDNVGYGWYVGEESDASGTAATYTVVADDLGKPIQLVIGDSTGVVRGGVQTVTAAVKKKVYAGTAAMAPTVADYTHNSVMLNPLPNSEYSNGGTRWQDSPTFNGLSPDVSYTFYSRIKETNEMEASGKSESISVRTKSLTVPELAITTQPEGAVYKYGDTINPLTVTVDSSDKLTYLWYKNTTDSTTDGTLVANTTTPNYTPTAKDAGKLYYYCVVSKTVEGKTATATSDTAAVEIQPIPIQGTLSLTGVQKAYDGTTNIVGTAPSFIFAGTINGDNPTATATFAYDTPTVGTGKTVNATDITLIAENKINANYVLLTKTATSTGAEIYAAKPTYNVADQKMIIGNILSNIQATTTATGVNGEIVAGKLTWSETQGGTALDSYIFTGAANSTQTLYWTFTPTNSNYQAVTGSSIFTLVEKEVPILNVSNIEKNYDGLEVTTVTGTAKVGDKLVEGTFAFDANQKMKHANTYNVTVNFTPADTANYESASISITVTIKKAELTIKADDKNILVGEAKPSYTATTTGLVNGETISGVTFTPANSDTSKKGTFIITPAGGSISGGNGNYNITYITGTLTIGIDVSAIDTAIANANNAKIGISENNNAPSAVANGTKFVTTAEMKSLTDAIKTASDAKTTVSTIVEAEAAVTKLDSAVATFLAAIKTGTYTAPSGGGGGSSGGGGGGSTAPTTPPVSTDSIFSTNGNVSIKPSVDENGNASVTISDQNVTDAIQKAQDEAKKNGTEKNAIAVTFTLDTDDTPHSFTANLPKATQIKLIEAGVTSLTINGGASITFDLDAIKQIKATANADVMITATKIDNTSLSKEVQALIGGRPVYDFQVTGGNKNITTFGSGGKLILAIPYELQKVDASGNPSAAGNMENPDNLTGVYIAQNGNTTYLPDSAYNEETKSMDISTTHLSVYGVAYQANAPTFDDIANHWAKDDIQFVVEKGILVGTSNSQFSPDISMTRGMFVTALGRLAQADVSGYQKSSFSDVATDSYYFGYVEWAVENNIVQGVGNGKFAPAQPINRQEMAAMLSNYAKATSYKLPSVHTEVTFTDQATIDTWAKSAVKEMQMAGILVGRDGGKFDPQGIATRAEVSAMFHRFVGLAANSEIGKD